MTARRRDPEWSAAAESRRFLLIAPTFPPSNEVGALRWQKMLPTLAARGWHADVVTLPPHQIGDKDDSRLAELPLGTDVLRVEERDPLWARVIRALRPTHMRKSQTLQTRGLNKRIVDPYAAVSLTADECMALRNPSLRVRANVRLEQDRAALWADDVLTEVRRRGVSDIKAVVTSGPPHAAHLAGRRVADAFGLPLLLDLRDPWADNPSHARGVACAEYVEWLRREESATFARAFRIVGNTAHATALFQAKHPAQSDRCTTVWNGADGEAVPDVVRPHRPFRLAFAGAIYAGRTPEPMFKAIARVVRRLSLTPDDFRFELMGDVEHVGTVPTMEMARQAGVDAYVTLHEQGSRAAARQFLARAHALVSLPWPGRDQVPAKIYEYADFQAWLIVLADDDTAPAARLRGTSAIVIAPDDKDSLERALQDVYERHGRSESPTSVNAGGALSREREALAFESLLAAADSTPARRINA